MTDRPTIMEIEEIALKRFNKLRKNAAFAEKYQEIDFAEWFNDIYLGDEPRGE